MNSERQDLIINGRRIGAGHATYIVAEMSANHNQSFGQALAIMKAAKEAGADAVKLQTYTAATLTLDSNREWFRVSGGTLWDGRSLYDLYQEAYTPWEWQPKLKDIAGDLKLDLFSTPFDDTAVDFLEDMNVPAYKIASFEAVDLQLIRRVARTGKPVILSTGMADLGEIDEAVRTFKQSGGRELALLKCTSAYPAPADEMNLRTIPHMAQAFNVPVGLSDHTLGTVVPVTAVALGACMIEKHFTLARADGGPDSAFSLEPEEFKSMVDGIRVAERALGAVHYGLGSAESKSRVFRRSLFIVEDVRAGERFTAKNLRSIRPGYGLHTRYLNDVLGRRATRDIERGTPLAWDLVGAVDLPAGECEVRQEHHVAR